MAIGDLYQLQVNYHLPDSEVSIALGYVQDAGTNDKDTMQSAVAFFQVNMLPALRNTLAVDCEVDQIRMDQVSVGNEIPGFVNLVGLPGTVLGQAIPSGGAAVVSWVTNAPNAKHNGRFYLAGVSEDEVSQGNLSAAQFALMGLLITALTAKLQTSLPQTATFDLATISRVLDGVPRVPPVGFLVLSGIARSPLYSQRRRITDRLGIS